MDIYAEQLVKKKVSNKDIVKKALIVAVAFTLAAASMTFAFATGLMTLILLAVGILFGAVWLINNTSLEYEYIVTNSDLDIDKIIAKKKRKRLITLKLGSATEFGAYNGTQGKDSEVTVVATDGTLNSVFYLLVKHSAHGSTMLLFSPDQRMYDNIISALPHKLKLELRDTDYETQKNKYKADVAEA